MTIIRYIRSDWSNHIMINTRYSDGVGSSMNFAEETDALHIARRYKSEENITKVSFFYPFNFIGPLPPNG